MNIQGKHHHKHKLASNPKVQIQIKIQTYLMVVDKHLHSQEHILAKVNRKFKEVLSKFILNNEFKIPTKYVFLDMEFPIMEQHNPHLVRRSRLIRIEKRAKNYFNR